METLEPKRQKKVVREGGPEHRAQQERESGLRHELFGEKILLQYREFERKQKEGTLNLNSPEDRHLSFLHTHGFENEIKVLISKLEDVALCKKYGDLFQSAIERATNTNRLSRLLRKTPTAQSFLEGLKNQSTPRSLIADFFVQWHMILRDRQARLEKNFEKSKADFMAAIPPLIARGELAADTDITLLQERISKVKIFTIDPLTADAEDLGLHVFGNIYVVPLPEEQRDLLRHVIFHELVHAVISGRKLALESAPSEIVEVHDRVYQQKVGLKFSYRKPVHSRVVEQKITHLFSWMNEAKTEKIARLMTGYDSGSYQLEIEAMHRLVQDGVPEILITEAFQEDHRLEEDGAPLPKVAAMMKKINEVKGNGWLLAEESIFATHTCTDEEDGYEDVDREWIDD